MTLDVDHADLEEPRSTETSMNLELDPNVDIYKMEVSKKSQFAKSLKSGVFKTKEHIKASVIQKAMSAESQQSEKNFDVIEIESDIDNDADVLITYETFEIGEIDSADEQIEEFGLPSHEYESI